MRSAEFIEMVGRVKWFSDIHYEILLLFRGSDIWLDAPSVARNIDYNAEYTRQQCSKLADAGLLIKDGVMYSLSDDGRAFVTGNLPSEEVEKMNPDASEDEDEGSSDEE